MYATRSQTIGPPSNSASRTRGRWYSTREILRRSPPRSFIGSAVVVAGSALDLVPRRGPGRVVLARRVLATVDTLGRRRLPIEELAVERRIARVIRLAVHLVHGH